MVTPFFRDIKFFPYGNFILVLKKKIKTGSRFIWPINEKA